MNRFQPKAHPLAAVAEDRRLHDGYTPGAIALSVEILNERDEFACTLCSICYFAPVDPRERVAHVCNQDRLWIRSTEVPNPVPGEMVKGGRPPTARDWALKYMADGRWVTVRELVKAWGRTEGATHRLVKRLMAQGYLTWRYQQTPKPGARRRPKEYRLLREHRHHPVEPESNTASVDADM